MITNQATLDAMNAAFYAKFDEIFANQPPGAWALYTEKVSTNSKTNTIDILETMPVVREWVGEKEYQDILASSLTVTCKAYEKSMRIKRMDFVADKMGMIGQRLNQFLSTDGASILDLVAFTALVSNSGAGPTCYDGVSLFSASHVRSNSTTWSNLTTSALSFSVFDTIMTAGASRVDNNNQPLRIAYDTLIVGPKNMKLAMEITESSERVVGINASGVEATSSVLAASTIPNVYGGGKMSLVVDPRLVGTQDDYCYFLDSKRGPKPLIMFELEAPHSETQDKMEDSRRFTHDEYLYSVECYEGVGAGSPHVCHAIVL